MRLYHTSIRYLDPGGSQVQIENPFVHHRNETLQGLGDPWLYGRAAKKVGSFLVGGRLGMTLPLGRTVEDPFVLGDMGIAHEHSQFGTGTVGLVAGADLSRELGRFHVELAALTLQTFYDNSHGYRAGDRYAVMLGIASHVGSKRLRLRTTVESVWETAETWSGVVHTDDGNVGRTDILAGLEATWQLNDRWRVGVSVKLPAYTHIEGGQLEALGFAGLTIGTSLQAFGGRGGEDEHGHSHAGHSHDGDHEDEHEH
ncbi:MAG: hypothetical protein HOV81_02070, partial [Kofleriaceae bacterium]|nr:hypothetical protein [Kofleriaceae bacterium]